MFTNDDLPLHGTGTIHVAGHAEACMEAPLEQFVVSPTPDHPDGGTLIVGDELGHRAGSYPFVDAAQLTDHMWRFVGPTDDFTLTIKET